MTSDTGKSRFLAALEMTGRGARNDGGRVLEMTQKWTL